MTKAYEAKLMNPIIKYQGSDQKMVEYLTGLWKDDNCVKEKDKMKYEKIPDLCKKYKIKKNLINPDYSG